MLSFFIIYNVCLINLHDNHASLFFAPLQNAKWAKGILQFIRYLLRQVSMDFTRWSRQYFLWICIYTPGKHRTAHFAFPPFYRSARKSWLPQIMRGWVEVSSNDWVWVRAVIKTRDWAQPAFLGELKGQKDFFFFFWVRSWGFSAHPGSAAHLSKLLIDDSKLEIVAYHVFIKCHNEPGCLWKDTFKKKKTHTYIQCLLLFPHFRKKFICVLKKHL